MIAEGAKLTIIHKPCAFSACFVAFLDSPVMCANFVASVDSPVMCANFVAFLDSPVMCANFVACGDKVGTHHIILANCRR